MRAVAIAILTTLAACGQTTAPAREAETATTSGLDLSGHLIAVGAEFRLDAIPDQNTVILIYSAYDQTVSGAYVAPQATNTGASLQTGDISLTLTPGACTHEGAVYPMRASVTITNGRPAEGCAVVTWDHHLLALMPHIDACITNSPDTRLITYAADTGEAVVTVRMQGNDQRVDCAVPNDAPEAQYAIVSARREEFRAAGESEALFVRGPGENPGGECFEAPEVRSASGELLGWMLDPQGC